MTRHRARNGRTHIAADGTSARAPLVRRPSATGSEASTPAGRRPAPLPAWSCCGWVVCSGRGAQQIGGGEEPAADAERSARQVRAVAGPAPWHGPAAGAAGHRAGGRARPPPEPRIGDIAVMPSEPVTGRCVQAVGVLGGHVLVLVALLGPAQAFSEVGGVEPGRERPG